MRTLDDLRWRTFFALTFLHLHGRSTLVKKVSVLLIKFRKEFKEQPFPPSDIFLELGAVVLLPKLIGGSSSLDGHNLVRLDDELDLRFFVPQTLQEVVQILIE